MKYYISLGLLESYHEEQWKYYISCSWSRNPPSICLDIWKQYFHSIECQTCQWSWIKGVWCLQICPSSLIQSKGSKGRVLKSISNQQLYYILHRRISGLPEPIPCLHQHSNTINSYKKENIMDTDRVDSSIWLPKSVLIEEHSWSRILLVWRASCKNTVAPPLNEFVLPNTNYLIIMRHGRF